MTDAEHKAEIREKANALADALDRAGVAGLIVRVNFNSCWTETFCGENARQWGHRASVTVRRITEI